METDEVIPPWIGSAVPSQGASVGGAASNEEPGPAAPSRKRILILGESWYGPLVPLSTYLAAWCAGSIPDHFFSCIFHAGAGKPANKASPRQRSAFWDGLLFDNFVNFSVGSAASHRPTPAQFRTAALTFPSRLAALFPDSVWVLGTTQQKYSVPVLEAHGYYHVPSRHPRSGVTIASLQADWAKL